MLRRILVLAIALSALSASAARTRAVASGPRSNGATVYGVVTAVAGNTLSLADGLVTIDATSAKIVTGRGRSGSMADITPGALVFATLRAGADSGALPADTIVVTRIADAALFGPVEAADVAGRTITLLGRTIHVTDETSFGGLRGDDSLGLDDVFANQLVQVETEARGGQLVATSVVILTPMAPPEVATVRGTVKSIAVDAWVIETKSGERLTLRIEPQTKIAGSPSVGNEVEVLYRVDSSNAKIAIAIVRLELPAEPFVKRVTGKIERIDGDTWTIAGVAMKVTRNTKLEPGLRVGDTVEALAQRSDDGTLVALAIIRKWW